MTYQKEKELILSAIQSAWDKNKSLAVDVEGKGQYDLVTSVDFAMEKDITASILSAFPDDIIIGEEFSPNAGIPQGRAWVVDPIDGTVNMARGLSLFGVQCALLENGEPVVSAMYFPYSGETYYAVKGEGAYRNGEQIHVVKKPLNACVLSFGDYSHRNEKFAKQQYELIGKIYSRIAKIRMFGSASIDFSLVARGASDGYIMYTRNAWDIFPGLLLAKEAGAIICASDGTPYDYQKGKGVMALANEDLLNLIKECGD